jgi:three-Cys-motif partner protein
MAPSSTVWPLDPHTKAKHDILRSYLGGWYPVLSSYHGRIVFLDGFAGPGIYGGGEDGSPVIALKTLLDHGHLQNMTNCQIVFVFCENDAARLASLREQVQRVKDQHNPFPRNVHIEIYGEAFSDAAQRILDSLSDGKTRKNLAPTFAFVDPFGFSGVPIDLLRDLLVYDRCELFVNLMVDHINRFATNPKVSQHMDDLFGTREYVNVRDITSGKRVQYLHDLYRRQLSSACGFPHVQSFAMYGMNGHLSYYLMHGTRHIRGVELMKDAMWKTDPGGGSAFHDRLADMDVLFQFEPDFAPLLEGLRQTFRGKTVTIDEVESWVTLSTPYRKAHLRKNALTPMEKAGDLVVARPGRNGFPAGTRLSFG